MNSTSSLVPLKGPTRSIGYISMAKPLLIVAGSYEQAFHFATYLLSLEPCEWRYVSACNQLKGIRDKTIIQYGSYWRLHDYERIREELQITNNDVYTYTG